MGEIGDRQRFMDTIVDRILGVLNREPIDIYVNPTFLPEAMAADYDALWRSIHKLDRDFIAEAIDMVIQPA